MTCLEMGEPDERDADDNYDGPPAWYELEQVDEPTGQREEYEAACRLKRSLRYECVRR